MFIDILAQKSRLRRVNTVFKICATIILLIIAVTASHYAVGMLLAVLLAVLTIAIGGLRLREYMTALALPLGFLLAGSLALLFELSPQPNGILSVQIFSSWLSISEDSLARATLVASRALGAVSCLICLSLSTPMPALIGALRRMHCPELVIDLMYLIYRYIFILLLIHHDMRLAARSRLGFRDYKTSIRATAAIYTNLLSRSYLFASKNFDAMESRCYDTGIRFLERK
ncbi:MAG: cobalt ECF transporter T component CbiQ [Deferribacteraceae bacterium]|jgi:cobalt/nickel transport system permease protein|nr:cobalt ECF transporter T component CbiQ [Deferribacteraceae bacterium]